MKKLISMLLTVIILTGITNITAFAVSEVVHKFPRREYLTTDYHANESRGYSVPQGAILRVEQGATLYIDSSFSVEGTLKNYGTIVVRDLDPKEKTAEALENDTTGYLNVSGVFENYGKVELNAASLNCGIRGYIKNAGKINLSNDTNPAIILLRVISYKNEAGGTRGGTFENTKNGVININITQGRGFVLAPEAKYLNEGKVYKTN